MKKLTYIFACFVLLLSLSCRAEMFCIPNGVALIESEAFSDIAADTVFIPESVTSCAADSFPASVTVICGVRGSFAEQYAADNSLSFVTADFSDIEVDCPPFVSPGAEFTVKVSCGGILTPDSYSLTVKSGDSTVCGFTSAEPDSFRLTLTEPGAYDFEVTCSNAFLETTVEIESAVEVYPPVALTGDYFLTAPGDSFCPVDEAETRPVTLSCESDGLSIEGTTITVLNTGTYTVSAAADCETGFCLKNFIVEAKEPVTQLTPSETALRLTVGSTAQLTCTIEPESLSDRTVTWVSSAPDVVSVDENGLVTALSSGSAVITLSTFRAEASVTISSYVPVNGITLSAYGAGVFYTGQRTVIDALVTPANADDKGLVWTSLDESIAETDAETGLITFLSTGTVCIRASAKDGSGITAEYTCEVLHGTESIELDTPSELETGDTYTVTAWYVPDDAQDTQFAYSVSDASVLSISDDGTVTAVAPGAASVIVRSKNGMTARAEIRVYPKAESIQPLETQIYIAAGGSFNLTDVILVSPAGTRTGSFSYETSSDCVTVSNAGTVKGVSAGTSIVTVKNGSLSCEITVTVVSKAAGATISPSYAVITCGDNALFTPSWTSSTPSGYKRGVWTVEDTDIAQIVSVGTDCSLRVRGVSPGITSIVFTSSAGIKVSASLNVNPKLCSTISLAPASAEMTPGETLKITPAFSPAGSCEVLSWSSSDTSVAQVDSKGEVTALSAGTALITAKTPTGKTASCSVTIPVVTMGSAEMPPEISGTAGCSFVPAFTYSPENATPAAFEWRSDDESVVMFTDGNGLFTGAGDTYIRGTALDGSGITLTAHVTVTEIPVRAFIMDTSDITLTEGDTFTPVYSVYPENASWHEAVVASSDDSVVRVLGNGVLSAEKAGSAVITLTAGRGSYEKSLKFTVNVDRAANTEYRALVMGQFTSSKETEFLPFSANGTSGVYDAFRHSNINGSLYTVRLMQNNPSPSSFRSAIRGLAALADEDDVTVIYIITHGHNTSNGYSMKTSSGTEIVGQSLVEEVMNISGHVVLCVCTCHSGLIFDTPAVRSLMANGGMYTGSSGAGCLSIITSSTNTKSCYYDVSNTSASYDFFTKAYTEGLGWNMIADATRSMSADSNNDGSVTVSELAKWSRSRTQYLISEYIQLYGTTKFNGDRNQYPKYFIAQGESDLVILSR